MRVCLFVPCGRLLGKGLISRLSFVVSNCEFVTFPLVSWVRCGTRLYQFLIFAPFLTLLKDHNAVMPVRLEPAASRSRVKHSTTGHPIFTNTVINLQHTLTSLEIDTSVPVDTQKINCSSSILIFTRN